MKLSCRLYKIYEMADNCNCIADIGTDHGYIPIYSCLNGKCKTAIAMDVSPGPLNKAIENIKKYKLEDKISARLSNGFEKLNPNESDTIVIAGMGGTLMWELISHGMDKITEDTTLILQPMLAQSELRQNLYENGLSIAKECVCFEDNKFYNIMKVVPKSDNYTLKDVVIGKNVIKDDVFYDYIDYKISVTKKIINGLKKSKDKDLKALDKAEKALQIYAQERRK